MATRVKAFVEEEEEVRPREREGDVSPALDTDIQGHIRLSDVCGA
jgi:hypothetical protein